MGEGFTSDSQLAENFKKMSQNIDEVKDLPQYIHSDKAMGKIEKEHEKMLNLLKEQQDRLQEKIKRDMQFVNQAGLNEQEQIANLAKELGLKSEGDQSAYTMNQECPGIKTLVALQGKVPVNVIGKVQKGDMLVASAIPGYAIADNDPKVGSVIGKAIGTKDDADKGVVNAVVGRV